MSLIGFYYSNNLENGGIMFGDKYRYDSKGRKMTTVQKIIRNGRDSVLLGCIGNSYTTDKIRLSYRNGSPMDFWQNLKSSNDIDMSQIKFIYYNGDQNMLMTYDGKDRIVYDLDYMSYMVYALGIGSDIAIGYMESLSPSTMTIDKLQTHVEEIGIKVNKYYPRVSPQMNFSYL